MSHPDIAQMTAIVFAGLVQSPIQASFGSMTAIIEAACDISQRIAVGSQQVGTYEPIDAVSSLNVGDTLSVVIIVRAKVTDRLDDDTGTSFALELDPGQFSDPDKRELHVEASEIVGVSR